MASCEQIDSPIFIGAQLAQQDLTQAKTLGIRTVIDLRLPGERATHHISVNKTALSARLIDELERAMVDTPGPHLLHSAAGARAALVLLLSHARQKKVQRRGMLACLQGF